jgi:hypothetical protein
LNAKKLFIEKRLFLQRNLGRDMKRLILFLILMMSLLGACQQSEQTTADNANKAPDDIETRLNKNNPAGTYGSMALDEETGLSQLLENPQAYEGKTVRVSGIITEVCPAKGCWVDIAGESSLKIRVKVNDGEIVFPLSSTGHSAVVEGVVEKIELSEAQARNWKAHEAEEKGEAFDSLSVQGPLTIWRIQGQGAEIN